MRASTYIHDCSTKCFIEWAKALPEAFDSSLVADRLQETLAKRKGAVFRSVMIVDPEITGALQIQVEAT